MLLYTGSGGGWGDPLEREPARVHWDVIEELVSREAARDRYGVVFAQDGSVDAAATVALRAQMKAARTS